MSAPGGAQKKRTVIVAKTAGFCFGVQRAVDTVYRLSEGEHAPVYTYGPIIHNEDVVASLEKRGVRVIGSIDEIDGIREGTIVIPRDSEGPRREASGSGGRVGRKIADR